MTYIPTLQQLTLLLTLPLGFFVGSVITHLKLQGAALATSQEAEAELDEEANRKAAIDRKKTAWKAAGKVLLAYLIFLVFMFCFSDWYPYTFTATVLGFHALLMAWISRTIICQLLGYSHIHLSRVNGGILAQKISTPLTLNSVIVSLLCLTLFPCTILFPSFLPAFALLSFAITTLFVQGSPWTMAKNAVVSLRWTFTFFLGFELLILLIGGAMGLALREGLFDGVGGSSTDASPPLDLKGGFVSEEIVQIEPRYGELIVSGVLFIQPFAWFMTVGWLLSLLYRLDVHIHEGKTGSVLVGTTEYERLPLADISSTLKPEGQKISLPPLGHALQRHLRAFINSPPMYFLTGTSIFISLLALLPFVLGRFESINSSGVSDDLSNLRIREAAELETTAALLAVLIAPWFIAVVIGLVSVWKGQGSVVWSYREVWGEAKGVSGVIEEDTKDKEVNEAEGKSEKVSLT